MDQVGSRLQSFKQFVLPESETVEKTTPVVPPYLKNAKDFSDKGLSQRVNQTNDWVQNIQPVRNKQFFNRSSPFENYSLR